MSGYDFGMLQPSSHQNKKSSPTFLVAIWSLFCLKKNLPKQNITMLSCVVTLCQGQGPDFRTIDQSCNRF